MCSNDELLATSTLGSFRRRDSFDDGCEPIDVTRPIVEKLSIDVVLLDDLIREPIRREARFHRNLVWVLDVTDEFVVRKPCVDRNDHDINGNIHGFVL